MNRLWLVIGAVFLVAFLNQMPASAALGLKIAPLEYRATLKKAERKKGFIDVSNSSDRRITVKTSVQSFTQVDDNGTLQFFDSEQVSSGVLLDLNEFELGPRQAIRMFFVLDGTKLPSGDVYAGIFFTVAPSKVTNGIGQSVRLGTLLSIVNGTPGQRKAEITALQAPGFVMGDTIKGTYTVKNTGDTSSTGFYPRVALSVVPLGDNQTQTSKLVFAGRSRENSFTLKAPLIGLYKVGAAYGESSRSKWVMVLQPIAIVYLIILGLIAWIGLFIYRRRTRSA